MNASGSDFVMLTEAQTGTVLVRKNGITPRDTNNSMGNASPLFLGDDLLSATESWADTGQKLTAEVQVSRAGKVIYSVAAGNPGATHDVTWAMVLCRTLGA